MRDDRGDTGAQHFDRDGGAVMQAREMHLRHRGRRDRRGLEFGEDFGQRFFVRSFQRGNGLAGRKRRHPVLQLGELVGDVERHQIAPGREHLPELDENGAERFQRTAQTHAARFGKRPPEQRGADQPAQRTHPFVAEKKLFQPEAQADGEDADQAEQFHSGWAAVSD